MAYQYINYETQNRISYITLNRPDKRNALNAELIAELSDAFKISESDKETKVIVLKANGKAFSAGADLAYLQQLQQNSSTENLADSNRLKSLFLQIYTCPKLVIAEVQGHAIAGGCGLVTLCDFVFAVPDALLGYTEVKIGFVPALVAPFALRKLGETRAKEMLLTGKLISASQGMAYGLINHIVEADELSANVVKFALELTETTSANSITATKMLLNSINGLPLAEALDKAAQLNASIRNTDDFKKGITAFLNKEKTKW